MFEGKGRPLTDDGLTRARRALGVDLATLWAVMTVETRGCGFLPSRRPVILFERHIFHRITDGRFDARAPDLSNPRAGGIIASIAVAITRFHSFCESPPAIMRLMPMTTGYMSSSVVTSSGHRYWFQP